MNTEKNTDKIRARRWGVAAATALLLCCGMVGGLWYQQQRAAFGMSEERQIEEQAAALEATPAQREQRLERLRTLREKWRPWALQHKAELQKMLRAQPNDQVTMTAVYNAVPPIPTLENAGFTLKEVSAALPGTNAFTWAGVSNMPKASNESDAEFASYQKFVAERLQENFAAMRDVSLSQAINTGRLETTLWVSGRITQRKWLNQDVPGQPSLILGSYQEVMPPYDFLKP